MIQCMEGSSQVTTKKSAENLTENDGSVVNGHESHCMRGTRKPDAVPGATYGGEYVIESTGLFTDADQARGHIKAGAKKPCTATISNPTRLN